MKTKEHFQTMISNYSVLTLPLKYDGKYKVDDTFKTYSLNWRTKRFDGLKIKNIDYCFGVRLHFDQNEVMNLNK